jgi:hypothetical protein
MLGGFVAGEIMADTYLLEPDLTLHMVFAVVILVLGLIGISSGFFSISSPSRAGFCRPSTVSTICFF